MTEPMGAPQGLHEDLLVDVLQLGVIAENPQEGAPDRGGVAAKQGVSSGGLPSPDAGHEVLVRERFGRLMGFGSALGGGGLIEAPTAHEQAEGWFLR